MHLTVRVILDTYTYMEHLHNIHFIQVFDLFAYAGKYGICITNLSTRFYYLFLLSSLVYINFWTGRFHRQHNWFVTISSIRAPLLVLNPHTVIIIDLTLWWIVCILGRACLSDDIVSGLSIRCSVYFILPVRMHLLCRCPDGSAPYSSRTIEMNNNPLRFITDIRKPMV